MKIKTYLISFLFLTVILSCQSTKDAAKVVSQKPELAVGLVSPIRLNFDQTNVLVRDYLDQTNATISKVSCSNGYTCVLSDDRSKINIRVHPNAPSAGNLNIKTASDFLDILLIKSSKQKYKFSFDPGVHSYETVSLVGDVNAWNPQNTPLKKVGGIWQADLLLQPGKYGYQVVVDGEWIVDFNNPNQMSNGAGGFNSVLDISDASLKRTTINASSQNKNAIEIHASNAIDHLWVYLNNKRINIPKIANSSVTIDLTKIENYAGRSHLRVWASHGQSLSNDVLIPLQNGQIVLNADQLTRRDLHTQTMYFLMVDRFYNSNHDNDHPESNPDIKPLANHLGGDINGVDQKLRDGYFDEIGANTIWLSPILENPTGAFGLWNKGGVRSKFSAYHGYWPISFKQIDFRFGSSEDLTSLVDQAHDKNKNVILDFVANHVHELHPVYQAHKDEGWATDLYLPDGSLNTEKWDEHRLTTWFDTFLPTLNLERQDVTEMLSDSALFLLEKYDLDGFRHDATKHIPVNFWQTLTRKIKKYSRQQGHSIYQVGETYGTPELISSYIGSGMLDGQFDFNMYDALVQTIVNDEVGFEKLAEKIEESFNYYGYHHLMGNMTGNQDKPRFMALATKDVRLDEDSKLAGWTRDINKKTDQGYDKLEMMHAFNFLLPGVPCIYYGDEIGMTGGNDPDNRRMMRFDNLTSAERELKSSVAKLSNWRRSNMALLYGDFNLALIDDNQLICTRQYFDQTVYALFNKSNRSQKMRIEINNMKRITSVKEHSFTEVDNSNLDSAIRIIEVEVPAYGYDFILFENEK